MEIVQYFLTIGFLQQVGILGFLVYIGAFGGVQFGVMDGNGALYSVCNILAASLVAISLIDAFNLASALIQGSWILISLCGLARRALLRAPRGPKPLSNPTFQEVV